MSAGGPEWSDGERELMATDKRLAKLMKEYGPIEPERDRRGSREDAYQALAQAICGQQLSTKAASTIWGRIEELFGGGVPRPEDVVAADPQELRDAGLSWAKVSYFRDLAERVLDGEIDLERLPELPDEEVIEELTAIKGIGRWTAEMFLIFHLGRPDVLSTGDLGIRKGAQLAYGLEEMPAPDELERMGERWRPHRTIACLYFWRALDNTPG
ncbi:MAG: DNA-3-methyladenine glycosylase 2 family protein [Actinobacteria bacterium]|nr:DNA-3-methyladenine glycosylase 2 family protein [Actinomycetota bacterium]